MVRPHWIILAGIALAVVLSGCGLIRGSSQVSVPQSSTSGDPGAAGERDLEMVTLLPRDAIPAIDNPQFLDVEAADQEYAPDEEVLGIFFDDEARAYSVPLLSGNEIVNDTVAGRKIAVTW